jgi:hypothetical protein
VSILRLSSDEYKAATITITASGNRATSSLVRIFRFFSRATIAFAVYSGAPSVSSMRHRMPASWT